MGKDATGISVHNGVVAVAVEAQTKQDLGMIVFFDTAGKDLSTVKVGALPDMVSFCHDGKTMLTACEGEPSGDDNTDPEGIIAVIDLYKGDSGVTQSDVTLLDFKELNALRAGLILAVFHCFLVTSKTV